MNTRDRNIQRELCRALDEMAAPTFLISLVKAWGGSSDSSDQQILKMLSGWNDTGNIDGDSWDAAMRLASVAEQNRASG